MKQESYALLTDLYQLTMAYGYWKEKMHEKEASFYYFFRKKPFHGEFAVSAGLATLIEFIETFHFEQDDLDYLACLSGVDGKPLFSSDFLHYLKTFSFQLSIDAVEEGTIVFPNEPTIRVQGPILHAQLLESPLLNIINFQTLIATKAARVNIAAAPDEVIEFGMRRAQGFDGAITASRAAFIGGCLSTSNVIAGKKFNIPVKGTQAHSWVMAFEEEKDSFTVFAKHMPGNCVFLIDTYDSLEGAKKAIEAAHELRKSGHELLGVRLDSGDLTLLSKQIRKLLDDAGLQNVKIMASNELDEEIIYDLKHQGAKIDIWGVGTALVTGKGQSAIDGVYKLSMIKEHGRWVSRMKISDQISKATTPGQLQLRRYYKGKEAIADMVYDELMPPGEEINLIHPVDSSNEFKIEKGLDYKELLIPIFKSGERVYAIPPLVQSQQRMKSQLTEFNISMKRFLYPTPYFVGLEYGLFQKKLQFIKSAKKTK